MAEAVETKSHWLERLSWLVLGGVALKLLWPASSSHHMEGPAPVLRLPNVATHQSILVAAREGRPLLIEVFASWCGACKRTSAALLPLEQAAKDGKLDVLAVSVDDRADAAQQAAETWPLMMPVLHDEHGAFSRAYEISVLPTFILIDARGQVREITAGPPGATDLRRWLHAAE